MDKQEVFDTAYNGVMNQNGIAIASEEDETGAHAGACFYRKKMENGDVLKCGVGHLLTDEELLVCRADVRVIKQPEIPLYDLSAVNLFAISSVRVETLPDHLQEHHELLTVIQETHDYAVNQASETFPEVTTNPEFESMFKAIFKRDMGKLAEQFNLKFNH